MLNLSWNHYFRAKATLTMQLAQWTKTSNQCSIMTLMIEGINSCKCPLTSACAPCQSGSHMQMYVHKKISHQDTVLVVHPRTHPSRQVCCRSRAARSMGLEVIIVISWKGRWNLRHHRWGCPRVSACTHLQVCQHNHQPRKTKMLIKWLIPRRK